MPEFLFDITLAGAIRVRAKDEQAARELLKEVLDCADSNLGMWPHNGDPILVELSLTEEPKLVEGLG